MAYHSRVYVRGRHYRYFVATLANIAEAMRKLCNLNK